MDIVSKTISILSGLGIITFIVFLLTGRTEIGSVQISTLLTVISFTLVGGLISIGGVKMFSFTASLRKSQNQDEDLKCPFDNILEADENSNWKDYKPGNPRFCMKCPLGIDGVSEDRGGLIHVCKVFPKYYESWKNEN